MAEVGSYRGVTTVKLADITEKRIFAVDPFIGYGRLDLQILSISECLLVTRTRNSNQDH